MDSYPNTYKLYLKYDHKYIFSESYARTADQMDSVINHILAFQNLSKFCTSDLICPSTQQDFNSAAMSRRNKNCIFNCAAKYVATRQLIKTKSKKFMADFEQVYTDPLDADRPPTYFWSSEYFDEDEE